MSYPSGMENVLKRKDCYKKCFDSFDEVIGDRVQKDRELILNGKLDEIFNKIEQSTRLESTAKPN